MAGGTLGNENKTGGEKEIPVWITGNVKHFDQNNDTSKIPGQTRDKERQKNNGNSGIRVRIIIF